MSGVKVYDHYCFYSVVLTLLFNHGSGFYGSKMLLNELFVSTLVTSKEFV